jgi:hypothetical protein
MHFRLRSMVWLMLLKPTSFIPGSTLILIE